eukprot:1158532-Pelagomonas_calceolata.AAC.9
MIPGRAGVGAAHHIASESTTMFKFFWQFLMLHSSSIKGVWCEKWPEEEGVQWVPIRKKFRLVVVVMLMQRTGARDSERDKQEEKHRVERETQG